tara:strand:+ start:678 stop:1988 length:1311 start_codon:yes stop_codon:yes gene_type:complete
MDIGFLFPSSEYLYDPFKGDPHTHFQILTTLDDYFDSSNNLSLIDLRGIKREFAQYHIPECDVYLHSVYTLDFDEQQEIVKGLRERFPKAKHIAGGPHANTFQEESLKIFDSLVLGDGEESIRKAIIDVGNLKLGQIYEQEGRIDINSYSVPSRRYLPESSVSRKGLLNLKNKKGFEDLLSTTAIFSRGCPYSCAFCEMPEVKAFNPGIRFRNSGLVKEEIEYLQKEYGVQGINLLDEIGIPLSRKKAISHLEAIESTGIVWRGQCRVDGVTPELAKLVGESGCVSMGLGVESVSQPSLDIIKKEIDIEASKRAIHYFHENGVETRIYLITGLPGEPEDIVERTRKFLEETKPEMVHLSLFTIRPGTEIYNNPRKYGIKNIGSDWNKTMHMHGKYEGDLEPTMTFEYELGKGLSGETILNNYSELQNIIREKGMEK